MMRFVLFIGMGVLGVLSGVAAERRVTLVDFRDPAAGRTAWVKAWGCDEKATATSDATAGCVRYAFPSNAEGRAGAQCLAQALRAFATNETGRLAYFYVRYRTDDLSANPSLQPVTTNGLYVTPAGFVPDGTVRETRVRPGGWNRNRVPFDPRALVDLCFGAGSYEIYEVGALVDDTPVPPVGQPVDPEAFALYPQPKVFRPGAAVFDLQAYSPARAFGPLAETSAAWFNARARRFWERPFATARGAPIVFARADTPEGRDALKRFRLAEDFSRVEYDGYALAVRSEGIAVVAHDDAGLMNGVRALMQTIHQTSGDTGPGKVRELTVVDWPRVANRLLYIPVYNCSVNGLHLDTDAYADLLDRFVFAARYNLVSFDLGTMYAWACDASYRPGETGWTPAEFSNLVDRVNAMAGRVVPFFMTPGHMKPSLFQYGGHPELREEGNDQALCLGHPKTYDVVFAHMREMSDICSHNPGYQSPVFYTGGDEVRWKARVPEERRCPHCRGVSRGEWLLRHMEKLDGWCRAQGYRMLMCSDMYVPTHNGLGPAKGALLADRLPKSIALLHWGGMDWDEADVWKRRGHDNWKVMTSFQSDPVNDEACVGYGFALYTGQWWLSRARLSADGSSAYLPANLLLAAAQGWGASPTPREGWRRAEEWGNFWMRNWSRKPIRHGRNEFVTIPLGDSANAEAVSRHDFATGRLGGVPVAFTRSPEARVRVLAADTAEHVVTLSGRFASLVFLQTGSLAREDIATFNSKAFGPDRMWGCPIATWRVAYADGTTETFTARFGWNVGNRETSVTGNSFERYIGDARFSWTDADGVTAYLHEWVNPHPEREIVSLTLEKRPTALGYELWALSARLAR